MISSAVPETDPTPPGRVMPRAIASHAVGPTPGAARGPAARLGPARNLEPVFGDWLDQHRDMLFGWTIARAADAAQRRLFAETAVAILRLRGAAGFRRWLFGAALLAAQQAARQGGLPETALAGLPPELRSALRLVSRAVLRPEEAAALLPQHMGFVRSRLLQTRLRR
jgi:DNA-directed RNA polymerase specialized sigma24 family protein